MSNTGRRGFLRKSVAAAAVAAGAVLTGRSAEAQKLYKKAPIKRRARDSEGTLIRGTDGHLYFLPDSALAPYRLSATQEANLLKMYGSNLKRNLTALEGGGVKQAGIRALKIKNILVVDLKSLRGSVKAYKVQAIKSRIKGR